MSDCTIRLATTEDAAFFPGIERSAGAAFLSIAGLEWIADDEVMSADQHRIWIAQGTVWVAIAAGRCIGFVTTAIYDASLHIIELSVADGHQGRGIGRRLLEAARDHAEAGGLQDITLTTFRGLPFNEHFYHKLGYRTLATTELPQRLADILQAEIGKGLPGDRRCAMRLKL